MKIYTALVGTGNIFSGALSCGFGALLAGSRAFSSRNGRVKPLRRWSASGTKRKKEILSKRVVSLGCYNSYVMNVFLYGRVTATPFAEPLLLPLSLGTELIIITDRKETRERQKPRRTDQRFISDTFHYNNLA